MSRKEDLEQLVLTSYQVIRENDQQIRLSNPKERARLQQETDEEWSYIQSYLVEYTALCERLALPCSEPVLQIAAGRFAELADRLIRAQSGANHSPAAASSPILNSEGGESAFRMNYTFVRSHLPMRSDSLAQFTLDFTTCPGVNLSQVNVSTHVCLILDVSGSMNQPEKYPRLLEAVPYVVDSLSLNDDLSIILFSSDSELIWSKNMKVSRNRARQIVDLIEQSAVKFGGTYLAPALQLAVNRIKQHNQFHPGKVTRVYILTDGQLNDGLDCLRLTNQLRQLEMEINSYGFGEDFAEDTMRQIMEGCQGGRVKWVSRTDTLWESFRHIGETASNIVATNAALELSFSSSVTPGDAFRFAPGTAWFGPTDDKRKVFETQIGLLERERVYTYAFETRAYPSQSAQEILATATLRYLIHGREEVISQSIVADRTNQDDEVKINKRTENVFRVLEGLRSNDIDSKMASLQARLEIVQDEGGDPMQIALIKKAIQQLLSEGTLDGLSDREVMYLNADLRTTIGHHH